MTYGGLKYFVAELLTKNHMTFYSRGDFPA